MATISKEKIYLKEFGEWVKVITYSKGLFRTKLPDIVCDEMAITDEQDKEITGKSEYEVNKIFKEKLVEWETAQTETKKVIVFQAKFQGGLLKEETAKARNGDDKYKPFYKHVGYGGDTSHHYFCCDDIDHFNTPSLGLLIQWGVYTKTSFKDKDKYKFISGRPFDSMNRYGNKLNSDLTEIEWTEERENFFLELDESFAKMIAKVYKVLGELTPEKLLNLADSGVKLLPYAK